MNEGQSNILLLGIGDCGAIHVNRFFQQNTGFTLAIANTDQESLDNSPVTRKITLGELTQADKKTRHHPAFGEKAAQQSRKELEELLSPFDHVILTAGLGGATGSGATPVIAQICEENAIRTTALVILPFAFEGEIRDSWAEEALENLNEHADKVVFFDNENLFLHNRIDKTTTFAEGFDMIAGDLENTLETIRFNLN